MDLVVRARLSGSRAATGLEQAKPKRLGPGGRPEDEAVDDSANVYLVRITRTW